MIIIITFSNLLHSSDIPCFVLMNNSSRQNKGYYTSYYIKDGAFAENIIVQNILLLPFSVPQLLPAMVSSDMGWQIGSVVDWGVNHLHTKFKIGKFHTINLVGEILMLLCF